MQTYLILLQSDQNDQSGTDSTQSYDPYSYNPYRSSILQMPTVPTFPTPEPFQYEPQKSDSEIREAKISAEIRAALNTPSNDNEATRSMAPVYTQGVDPEKYPTFNPGLDNEAIYQKKQSNEIKSFAGIIITIVLFFITIYIIGKALKHYYQNRKFLFEDNGRTVDTLSSTNDKIFQLNNLHELFKNGAFSETEYQDFKNRILQSNSKDL